MKSSSTGDILESQVAQVVQETGQLKGVGLELKGSDGLTAGDIDILTDSYIIEVKKSLGAVKLKQLDKLINPNNPNFFNYDGKNYLLHRKY